MQPGADGMADHRREKWDGEREREGQIERETLTPGSVFCSWRAFWALMADSRAQ